MEHFRLRLLAVAVAFLLAGCGYRVAGRSHALPEDVQTVAVVFFTNRTLEPLLENAVTVAVVERFSRGRALRIVDRPESADAVLTGTVTSYASEPVAYDRSDEIARWRSTMQVSAGLRRAGKGEVLWRGALAWSEEYAATPDRSREEENEATVIRVIAERIAEEMYFRLAENF